MKFSIHQTDPGSGARTGEITTARGNIKTPVFMPVATRGAIRAMSAWDFESIGFEIFLANTYHLYIRPGIEVLGQAGGLHPFMDAKIPLLTDSGGFQVFSLSRLCKVMDEGVEFRSHLDGSAHFFTPEKVLDIQRVIGSDIMMPLDQCAEYPIDKKGAAAAVKKTLDWAQKSSAHWRKSFDTDRQALFGIIQGSVYSDLREQCVSALAELDLPGYSIGGLSVGEPPELYREITEFTLKLMPVDKPRYMMGVGSPMEILWAVMCGVDMFDCVMPTRIARNGTLYTSQGRINIKGSAYEKDSSPLDPNCGCPVCRRFTRAYLRHIFKMGEISAMVYNTLHNLWFMKKFMDDIRLSIINATFSAEYAKWDVLYRRDKSPL